MKSTQNSWRTSEILTLQTYFQSGISRIKSYERYCLRVTSEVRDFNPHNEGKLSKFIIIYWKNQPLPATLSFNLVLTNKASLWITFTKIFACYCWDHHFTSPNSLKYLTLLLTTYIHIPKYLGQHNLNKITNQRSFQTTKKSFFV